MPELVFFRLGQELLRVAMERQRMVLGSGAHCDVVLPDPDLKPQHVALMYDGTRCFLEDLSGQGTQVSGRLMRLGELQDGMDLVLGQWGARFRLRSSAPEPSGPEGHRTDVQPLEALSEKLPPVQVRIKQGSTEFLHELSAEPLTVGTDPKNGLVLEDSFVSGRHLQVTRLETGFHVLDLGSTNGTFQGNLRIIKADVPLHTMLRVGDTELYFEPLSRGRKEPSFHGIVGEDPLVRLLVKNIQVVAPTNAVVAVLGESGTGKELVAHALHHCSPRARRPFIAINCAALSPGLIESELFGHEKGAFTGADTQRKGAFQEAHTGTLFLDEIGELPLELQAKLLRVLDSGELMPVGTSRTLRVDVRVVVATHRDLWEWVQEGRFREDLYYRLSGVPLLLPPLRHRGGDIRLLAEYFVRLNTPREQNVKLTPAALDKLAQHDWPGNIRELRNVVHHAMLFRKGSQLTAENIRLGPSRAREPQGAGSLPSELPAGMTLEQLLQQVERRIIENTLRKYRYNKERTARHLGVGRTTLFKRIKEWEIEDCEEDPPA